MDKLEKAMQNDSFWVELSDTSFGQIVFHGKDYSTDAEYYEISTEISNDGDWAMLFFKTYDGLKKWLNKWQGDGFYDYLVELYEKNIKE